MTYYCPLCKHELTSAFGHKMYPNDPKHGVTLFCPSRECPAQEVMGHGNNIKEAWEVVQARFVEREFRV